jgi:glucose-6-phosphate isomerase
VQLVGAAEAARRFIAITDPGSMMQDVAERDGFRRVFFGWPTIGGCYSVLSDFGLVPAAIMGMDVETLLDRTEEIVAFGAWLEQLLAVHRQGWHRVDSDRSGGAVLAARD